MIYLINYADKTFKNSQHIAILFAKLFAKVDTTIALGPENIDDYFRYKNASVLSEPKGGGYWLWKPYFLKKYLAELNENDWLVYMDSGMFLYKDITNLLRKLDKQDQDVFGFELPLLERQWTKRAVYDRFGLDPDKDDTNQIMATAVIIKKSKRSVGFVEDYLKYCLETDLLDDSLNSDQCADFIEHRHDQSIFSMLYKVYGFKACQDFSQRDKMAKSYALFDLESIKGKNILYKLSDGRLFRKNSINLISTGQYAFMHKSSRPLKFFLRYILKFFIGYNRKRYL